MYNVPMHDLHSNLQVTIAQSELDITNKTRTNPLTWNGQFSPQLVESILQTYANKSQVIFDPFSGSGTVAFESLRIGKSFLGTEINPAAFLLARLYTISNFSQSEINFAVNRIDEILLSVNDNFLESPIPNDVLEKYIINFSHSEKSAFSIVWTTIILIAFKSNSDVTKRSLLKARSKIVDLAKSIPRGFSDIYLNDARKTVLPDNACDFVITSPPYINVYNYHQQYRPITEFLGYKPLNAATAEIGANRKHRSNRFLTVIQYCLDLTQVLIEMSRVCKDKSHAILVIGRESNVLGTRFENANLVEKILAATGYCCVSMKQERKFINRFGQTIFEDILHFKTTKEIFSAHLLDDSREIARLALINSLRNAPDASKSLINDAIHRYQSVMPSPHVSS